jgi:hypothetical protein
MKNISIQTPGSSIMEKYSLSHSKAPSSAPLEKKAFIASPQIAQKISELQQQGVIPVSQQQQPAGLDPNMQPQQAPAEGGAPQDPAAAQQQPAVTLDMVAQMMKELAQMIQQGFQQLQQVSQESGGDKEQKPKKPSANERIEALEQQISQLTQVLQGGGQQAQDPAAAQQPQPQQ